MRKKDRIKPFCERLADAWEKCPDMRFGQFICNVYATELKRDPFYIEDDESMRLIEKCANECSPYHKPPKEEERKMSVIIRGMKMPKSCGDCWAMDDHGDYPRCHITGEQHGYTFGYSEYRMPDCPLVQVPTHGRLIDADAMEKTMSDIVQGDIRGYPYSDTQWDMAFRWIDHQPTIIEAEEG